MISYTNEQLTELLRGAVPPPEKWVRRAEAILRTRGGRRGALRGFFLPSVAPVTAHAAERVTEEESRDLPAWSLRHADPERLRLASGWSDQITREWAWGGSSGKGVRVCVLDSGIDGEHSLVGPLSGSVAVTLEDGEARIEEGAAGDLCGHGTACAGIIRSLAPECSIFSVRVLGAGFSGSGAVFASGVRWALDQGFDVINLSLSTTRREYGILLHDLADSAYFQQTILVASAHNMAVESYPWRFSSLISVGSHREDDPFTFFYNPEPPVEFFARGVDVELAWLKGGTIRATGNSFATPHIAGLCALILAKHPELKPFQLKTLLYLTASNVGEA